MVVGGLATVQRRTRPRLIWLEEAIRLAWMAGVGRDGKA